MFLWSIIGRHLNRIHFFKTSLKDKKKQTDNKKEEEIFAKDDTEAKIKEYYEKNFEQLFWEDLTCWTEAASAQGSLPRVSSLGVSFGGLNFIPTLLLEPAEELDLQMILDPLSLLVDTILTISTLRPPNCAPLSSLLVHFIQIACHCTQGYQTESPCHWGLQLLTLTSSEGGIPINIRVQFTQELLSWIQVTRCRLLYYHPGNGAFAVKFRNFTRLTTQTGAFKSSLKICWCIEIWIERPKK